MSRDHMVLPGRHESLWLATTPETRYPSLTNDIAADVAVIGGGLVGVTSALLLAQSGFSVVLFESRRLGTGVTGHTTAKITSQHRRIYHHLIEKFGKAQAQLYADANQGALEKMASLIQDNNIDCDFTRMPAYTYALTDVHLKKIKEEVEAAQSLSLPAAFVDAMPLPIKIKGAVRFDNQAQFHPGKYMLGLASALVKAGGHIFEKNRVVKMEGEKGKPNTVYTGNNTVTAKHVIVATNFPIHDGPGFYFARLYASRSYVLGVRIQDKFPEGMFISSEEPGYSYRSQPAEDGGEIILVLDGEHVTGRVDNTFNRYRDLEAHAREVLKVQSIDYWWSTQDNFSLDEVPYIGQMNGREDRIYVATGFRKWGMTNSTAAAMILRDIILGQANPWASVFDPGRFNPVASGIDLVKQNLNSMQHLVTGFFGGPHLDLTELANGEAKVGHMGRKKIAVYKDEQGKVYKLDSACQHMGCNVTWNNAERSWDCPCHGSRYNYDGTVINSPTVRDLKKIE